MMHWGTGFGGFGFIFMIIFWALVIFGIVYLVKYISSNSLKEGRKETAEDILKKRYASGEISKNEFDEKIKVISEMKLV
jgi:putative membrane protein